MLAAFGIAGWAELGLDLPVVLHQSARILDTRVAPQGLGDLRITTKGTILRTPRRGWGLGLAFDVTAPTGRPGDLAGMGGPSFAPQILFENRGAHAILSSFNLGYLARREVSAGGVVAGDAITYRGAVRIPVSARKQVSVFTELDGAASLVRRGASPLSLRAGLRWQTRGGMVVAIHAGGAPIATLGIPQLQVGFSLAWGPVKRMRSDRAFDGSETPGPIELAKRYDPQAQPADTQSKPPPDPADPDGDGITTADRCPDVAEDDDEFEDEDGCPELDNDRDGLRDEVDLCRTAPELINGYQDWDGCPDIRHEDGGGETFATFDPRRVLPALRFKPGTHELDEASREDLARFAQLMLLNPWIDGVQLGVFVPAGDNAADLAAARATVVLLALQADGVAPGRISILPGKTVPNADAARVRLTLGRAAPRPVMEAQGPTFP